MNAVFVRFSGNMEFYIAYGIHNVQSFLGPYKSLGFERASKHDMVQANNTAGLLLVTFHPPHTTGKGAK